MIWSGQDGEPVLKRNNLFRATCLSCLYLFVPTKVNNQERICKGNQSIPPANLLHDMVHVDGLSARHSSPPMATQFVNDDFALFSQPIGQPWCHQPPLQHLFPIKGIEVLFVDFPAWINSSITELCPHRTWMSAICLAFSCVLYIAFWVYVCHICAVIQLYIISIMLCRELVSGLNRGGLFYVESHYKG